MVYFEVMNFMLCEVYLYLKMLLKQHSIDHFLSMFETDICTPSLEVGLVVSSYLWGGGRGGDGRVSSAARFLFHDVGGGRRVEITA